MNKLFGYIFFFSITSIIGMFFSIFIFQIGDQYVLTELNAVANDSYNNLGISEQMQTHIGDSLQNYRDMNLPYDLFFLLSFITIFGLSIFTAYSSREQSYASFLGSITLGLMMFLFIMGFVITIADWLVLNLIQNVVEFDMNTTPIFLFFTNNLGIISFIWAFLLIIINKLTFTLNRGDEDINDYSSPEELGGEFQK